MQRNVQGRSVASCSLCYSALSADFALPLAISFLTPPPFTAIHRISLNCPARILVDQLLNKYINSNIQVSLVMMLHELYVLYILPILLAFNVHLAYVPAFRVRQVFPSIVGRPRHQGVMVGMGCVLIDYT